MVKRGSDTLLFDCGEGAQQQMMRARTGFVINAIFISHWHADHFLGILGLVETLGFMGREEPLTIYGPEWVREFVDNVSNLSKKSLKFPLIARELRHGDAIPFKGYHIRAFATDHGIKSLGYILKEDPRPGKFNRERAVELGIPPGPLFGKLQRGETIRLERDSEDVFIRPDDVMGLPRPGRTIVYTGDTRPGCQNWMDWGLNANLLIHDATFDDEESDRAAEVFHSTAGQAAEIAHRLSAQHLALVHISSRYTSSANHLRDAIKRYKGEVIVPDDLEMIELPFRG
jgi:ribonuclease Z